MNLTFCCTLSLFVCCVGLSLSTTDKQRLRCSFYRCLGKDTEIPEKCFNEDSPKINNSPFRSYGHYSSFRCSVRGRIPDYKRDDKFDECVKDKIKKVAIDGSVKNVQHVKTCWQSFNW